MAVNKKYFIIGAIGLAALVGAYLLWQGKSDADSKKPRTPVQVIKSGIAEQKAVPVTISANGYVTAINTVDVRPQVQNVVRTVHVQEGQEVRAGQLLFTLDQRGDTANLDKAQAQVTRDRADLAEAEASLKRNQDLLAKNFVSQAVVDTARAKVDSLRGALKADQAAAQSSNVSLSYNQISASIAGRLGAISVHPGSLAQPSGAPMVTIAQLDPISVSFSVPENQLTYIRASYPKGDAPVTVQLQDKQELKGNLYFIDNAADTQSGTIRMKAQFDNRERKMWPGTYVNLSMVSRTLPDAVVIPAQAIVTGPADKFVYAIQPDETVKAQKIEVINIDEGQAAVSGVKAGTRLVVEGAQNLRPGAKVKEMQTEKKDAAKDGRGSPGGKDSAAK